MSETMEVKLLQDVVYGDDDGKQSTFKGGKLATFPVDVAKDLLQRRVATRPSKLEVGEETNTFTLEEKEDAVEKLIEITGINNELADLLFENGFTSVALVAEAKVKDLVALPGIGNKSAPKIIESAQDILDGDSE